MVLVTLFTVTACSSSKRPSAQEVVENALDAIKSGDNERAAKYWGEGFLEEAEEESDEEIIKAIFQGVSYKIVSSDEDADSAVVTVKISNKDISSVLADTLTDAISNALSSAFSGDDMDEDAQAEMITNLFMEKLKSSDYKDVEKEVDISLSFVDGNWVIDEKQMDVYDALTGGLFSIADNFSDLDGSTFDGTTFDDTTFDDTTEPEADSMIWSDVRAGETVELATINIRVTGCEEVQEMTAEYFDPDVAQSGTKYVVFYVDIENTTKAPIDMSNDIPLVDDQGRSYYFYSDAIWYYDETFTYTTLSPNIVKSGVLVYNVPSDSENYYLAVSKNGTSDAFRLYGN